VLIHACVIDLSVCVGLTRCVGRGAAEAELRASGASSLLVGRSLQEVEDDDEVTRGDAQHFYRVFGSPRVLNNRCVLSDIIYLAYD
jgi:hypothetical protein